MCRAQRAADPLRPTGGARGVEHERSGRPEVVGPFGRLTVDQFTERTEAANLATDHEAVRFRRVAILEYPGGLLTEAGVDDECLGLGVVHDVADLGADQMPVHGGDVVPALERGETDRDLFEAVGQHRRDLVPRLQPERPQAVHDLIGERVELTEGHLLVIGIDDGEMVGIGFGDFPETQDVGVGHRRDGGRPDATAPIEGGSAEGFGRSRQVTALRMRYSGVSHASVAMISIRISTARSMSASPR